MTYEEKQFVKALERLGRVPKKRVCRTCKKCGSHDNIVTHHITYKPAKTAKLCTKCHAVITAMNTVGSLVTGTSKKYPKENNKVRLELWKNFMSWDKPITIKVAASFLGYGDYEFSEAERKFIHQAKSNILEFKKVS